MADMNSDIIAQIAAQKLGPAAAPAAPQQAPQEAPQAPQAPQAPKASQAPTSMEQAQAKVAPNDPSKQEPQADVQFIKVGDKEYTDSQLTGMMGRYKDLNHKWASNKPVIDVISQLMESAKSAGHDAKPEEMAALVQAAVQAFVKNPQMGNQQQSGSKSKSQAQPAMSDEEEVDGDPDAMYEQWEKENAVKLPPGFKETAATSKAMASKMDQMMSMFQQLMQGGVAGQNAMQQSSQAMDAATSVKADAATTMISNNLNSAFQKAGIAPDPQSRSDFRMFAAQRGYDFPDFLDAGLTATVVADYKANKDAPEISRLREIAQKRQAFTGMVDGAPGTGGASPAAPADPMLQAMIQTTMKQRGM